MTNYTDFCCLKIIFIIITERLQAAHTLNGLRLRVTAAREYKAEFWCRYYVKNLCIADVCKPITSKLNREPGEWWKCNNVVFLFGRLRFFSIELGQLRFVNLDFVSNSS